ncbi:MAG TPA: YjgN family protein [Bradyrhizobium sp.]|nr:YjgN family protein [Bradyrhizobium sp.]
MSFVPRHPPPSPVSFSGDRGEFRRLVTRGAMLELITIGFYRFWLATDIRRHLWSNTHIDGDAAEYTGRGKELLIGFLFALAILMPVYLAYFLVSIEAERLKAFAGLPLFAFFYLFGQFAIYRARRYRLTRTVWRGVRFWMDGSGWAYAMRAALWALLMPLTLGLILPWREAALERYKMRHCYYGELQGSFEGSGWDFFKRGWWLWLMAVAPLIALLIILPLSKFSPLLLMRADRIAPFVSLFMMLSAPFIYGVFKAVEWRWWLSGIRFGEVRFESALLRGALVGLYWKVIGWFLLLVVLFTAYLLAGARLIAGASGLSLNPAILQQSVSMLVVAGIGYLAFILALNVVIRVYLVRDVWARVTASTAVHNIEAVADISVGGELADAIGEGLAGGLDVVGF